MIQLFDIQDKRVVPHANCYLIPELKSVIEYFKSDYLKVLSYIAFMTVPDSSNPYFNTEESTKEEIILLDLKPYTFYVEDLLILKAIDKCNFLFSTPTLRAFMGAKKALDRVGQYLATTEITDGKDGSAMTIDRYMSKLAEYTDTYTTMENKLKEEQAKVRGSIKLRYDQKPGYSDTKSDKEEDGE